VAAYFVDSSAVAKRYVQEEPVQLAAALELDHISQGGVVLVWADKDLNAAAAADGLAVEDPNAHP